MRPQKPSIHALSESDLEEEKTSALGKYKKKRLITWKIKETDKECILYCIHTKTKWEI